MTWTAPANWSYNETVTAAKMNAQIRDNLTELLKYSAKGDLVAATGASTCGRVPAAGADSMVLISSSGQATNMTWSNWLNDFTLAKQMFCCWINEAYSLSNDGSYHKPTSGSNYYNGAVNIGGSDYFKFLIDASVWTTSFALITASVRGLTGSPSYTNVVIKRNGAENVAETPSPTLYHAGNIFAIYGGYVVNGDYFELFMNSNAGGSQNVHVEFSIHRLASIATAPTGPYW